MSRTLVVTNDFPPRRGGIETYVRQLCDELPPDGVVVHTSTMPGDAAYDRTLPFPVVRDPARTLLPTGAVAERVAQTFTAFDCDRVVFGAAAPLGLLAPDLRRAGAVHLTALSHGHEVWWAALPVTRRLLRRIGDDVDVWTYVSDHCGRRIAAALSPDAVGRMVRRSPRVDLSRFRTAGGGAEVRRRHRLDERALVVVCVARLVRRKGQDTLLRIWPEVLEQFPDAVLVLVGEGPGRARLERMTARRGIGSSVRFVGSVPWEDVPAHLDAADVFAMPCRDRLLGLEVEAFGIVFLEAAAAGLPIVAGRSGGVADALAAAHPGQGKGRHVQGRDGPTPRLTAGGSPR